LDNHCFVLPIDNNTDILRVLGVWTLHSTAKILCGHKSSTDVLGALGMGVRLDSNEHIFLGFREQISFGNNSGLFIIDLDFSDRDYS
jgi:hypothetical protein